MDRRGFLKLVGAALIAPALPVPSRENVVFANGTNDVKGWVRKEQYVKLTKAELDQIAKEGIGSGIWIAGDDLLTRF